MFEKWDRELRKKVKEDERLKGDILKRVSDETFVFYQHNMLVDKVDAINFYDEDLERADLDDYLKLERKYGRTNKTR